jgi:hypothetical protein
MASLYTIKPVHSKHVCTIHAYTQHVYTKHINTKHVYTKVLSSACFVRWITRAIVFCVFCEVDHKMCCLLHIL